MFDNALNGARCPGCSVILRGRAGLRTLQADHIVAWSKGGLTTWANLQLLCRPCNVTKSDKARG
jgi:5-methylcytosine-specific restriction endonuclease McrA